ncbi:survival motor neuron interacting protein 1-domain-containing protein [Pilobolus umbonatus]|nr:survival motor neuron interacting protein 1-domain-containing protein [Pilobolus umbonatus]
MSKRIFSRVNDESEENHRGAIPLMKKKPDLVNGIPLSGEDYLLLVRQQAQKSANISTAPPPPVIKKANSLSQFLFSSNNESNNKHTPSAEWSEAYGQLFTAYQSSMQRKSKKKEKREIKTSAEVLELLYPDNTAPSLSIISTFTQHTILRTLHFHIQWLKEERLDQQCLCLYHLLVYLDSVLTSNNISKLRDLSRKCIELRESPSQHIGPLNIIITIIATAYGQKDLI